jgi:hypothetical protein
MTPLNQNTTDGSTQPTAATAAVAEETIQLRGAALTAKVKDLIHQGNVRRIVIKNDDGHTVMEIPVTAGLLAPVIAPILTAVGAIAALVNNWTIEVHRQIPS